MTIDIIKTTKEMQMRSDRLRREGKTIAFVPTMGFLHQGHLSLMQEARKHGDDVVVSIFVNPTQFGQGEDFECYPKDFERDVALIQAQGVNALFYPTAADIYPPHYQTYVYLEHLPNFLCGLSRPTHFRGVATVVTKLFNIVKPHVAVFGKKDFQQVQVITQMVKDLNFDIKIVGAPIVREADGLAMSSRNTYLTPDQRESALCLYLALNKAKEAVHKGQTDAQLIIDTAKEIISNHPETSIDYIKICDLTTLEDKSVIDQPVLMALAVKVGKTRLIDNMELSP